MEVEYSHHINEFFCSPDCATDRYFERMRSTPLDFSSPLPEGVMVVDGLLTAPPNYTLEPSSDTPDDAEWDDPDVNPYILDSEEIARIERRLS